MKNKRGGERNIVTYPMFREYIGYLLHVAFCEFLRIFLYLGKERGFKEAPISSLRPNKAWSWGIGQVDIRNAR